MIMCVLVCYPVSFHMLQLLSTGRPIYRIKQFFLGNIVIYEARGQVILPRKKWFILFIIPKVFIFHIFNTSVIAYKSAGERVEFCSLFKYNEM